MSAEWVRATGKKVSPFGERVANLLGVLFAGIYHIERDVYRADWSTEDWINLTIIGQCWATWDFDTLTRLVLLAHDQCIRIDLDAAAPRIMRLRFHPRLRTGPIHRRHPTIEEAVHCRTGERR